MLALTKLVVPAVRTTIISTGLRAYVCPHSSSVLQHNNTSFNAQCNYRSATSFSSNQCGRIVGINDFVDKTLLIKTLFNAIEEGLCINLIFAPSWFEKTVNLKMIKAFIGIAVDDNGTEIAEKTSISNYRMFKGLNIMEYSEYVEEHLAQHPVIYLDFKNVCGFRSLDNTVEIFKELLSHAFGEHKCLLKCPEVWAFGNEYCVSMFNKYWLAKHHNQLNITLVEDGLKQLSGILLKCFNKQVFVLIDEYDAPINDVILAKMNHTEIDPINKFLNAFSSIGLKSSPYISCSSLTSITHVSGLASSSFNNIQINKFLFHHDFVEYYGFTQKEVEMLFDRCNVNVDLQKEAKEFYNGYTSAANIKLYSPSSIISFLIEEHKIDNYWAEQSRIKTITKMFQGVPEIQNMLKELIHGKCIDVLIQETISIDDYKLCEGLFFSTSEDETNDQIRLYCQFLLEMGYLSFVGMDSLVKIQNAIPVTLSAPNKEILSELHSIFAV